MRDRAVKTHILQIRPAPASRFRWFSEHARLRQGSGQDLSASFILRRGPGFYRFAPAKKCCTLPCLPHAIARFAQGPATGSGIVIFRTRSCFGIRFQIIRNPDNFSAIVPAGIYGSEAWIIFKWLIVLYVDPQNLMTNRRNRPPGKVLVPREKTIQATRYK